MKLENKEISTFDYLDSINLKKDDLMTPDNENKYNSYLINHFLSGSIDTLFFANETNQRPFLDRRLQYDYLKYSVRKKYRRSKWLKPDQIENLKIIQNYYGYNIARAKEALRVLTTEDIQQIKSIMNLGGTK
jgi:hypothetical protein